MRTRDRPGSRGGGGLLQVSGWVWLEGAWHLLGLGLAGSALEGGVGGRRQGAGARRGSVEARRRRKAEAKAGRKRAFEASAARAAAVGRTAVEHAAAKRAAAERARVVAAISALERRAATKWSASCDTLAAVFEGDGGDGQTAPYRAPAAAPSLKEARRRRTLTARGRRGAALLCWQVQLQAWEGQEATAHALAR
jgi:hypothetical protein